MTTIDPRMDCIRQMRAEEKIGMAKSCGFMAAKAETLSPTDPEVAVQVFIQVIDPEAALDLPGVMVRSRLGDILTAEVMPSAISHLEAHANVAYVERGVPIYLEDAEYRAVPEDEVTITIPDGPLANAGEDVIVGVIDWGCDFTHRDFIDENGSRILYFWDQRRTPTDTHRSPDGYAIGVEYSKADLDEALDQPDPFAALGMAPPDPGAHGTHVMGIAAGSKQEGPSFPRPVPRLAAKAGIIFVQPNTSDVDVIGGFGDSVNLAEAVKYIFDKARKLGRPAVINMSMGTNFGPHDGTSLVERWIDRHLDVPGRAVVLALGNEHQQQRIRTHSSGSLETGESTTLFWRVTERDETYNEMEIWYSGRDRISVEVTLPTSDGAAATTVPPVGPGEQRFVDVGNQGTRLYVSNEVHTRLNGDNHINIIMIAPAGHHPEAGVWQVKLTSLHSRDGGFDAWIERDARSRIDTPQSNFVAGSYVREKTLGSIQSSRHAITVSNYDSETGNLADSTSYGPTRDGRRAPTVAAPGVGIWAANAVYRTHPNPEGRLPYIPKTGTSMSAPFVAGLVACMLHKNPQLTTPQIKGLLAANAKPALGHTYEYRNDWGNGRVDPVATLDATPA